MVSFTVKGHRVSYAEANPDNRFPKLLSLSEEQNTSVIIHNRDDLLNAHANPGDVVVEAYETPKVTVGQDEHELVLGRDYDVCVILTPTRNVIIKDSVPPPILSASLVEGFPRLMWTSAFSTKTKVYRTFPVLEESFLGNFSLVAEVAGVQIPNTMAIYTDISFGTLQPGMKVAYRVENYNGISEEVSVVA